VSELCMFPYITHTIATLYIFMTHNKCTRKVLGRYLASLVTKRFCLPHLSAEDLQHNLDSFTQMHRPFWSTPDWGRSPFWGDSAPEKGTYSN